MGVVHSRVGVRGGLQSWGVEGTCNWEGGKGEGGLSNKGGEHSKVVGGEHSKELAKEHARGLV